jgi:hypothetical protein
MPQQVVVEIWVLLFEALKQKFQEKKRLWNEIELRPLLLALPLSL